MRRREEKGGSRWDVDRREGKKNRKDVGGNGRTKKRKKKKKRPK